MTLQIVQTFYGSLSCCTGAQVRWMGDVEGRASVRVSLLDEAVYRDGWTKALFEFVCIVGTLVVFGALGLPLLVSNETN